MNTRFYRRPIGRTYVRTRARQALLHQQKEFLAWSPLNNPEGGIKREWPGHTTRPLSLRPVSLCLAGDVARRLLGDAQRVQPGAVLAGLVDPAPRGERVRRVAGSEVARPARRALRVQLERPEVALGRERRR